MSELKFEVSDTVAAGVYANATLVKHNHTEFIMDSLLLVEESGKAVVQARVRLSPTHAKALLKSLDENIKNYEATFGKIYQPVTGLLPQVN